MKSSLCRLSGLGVLRNGAGADGAILHHGPYVLCHTQLTVIASMSELPAVLTSLSLLPSVSSYTVTSARCVCVCVCVDACAQMCMLKHLSQCMYTYGNMLKIFIHMHVSLHIIIYIAHVTMYNYVYLYTHTHTHMHMHTHKNNYVYLYTHTHTHMHMHTHKGNHSHFPYIINHHTHLSCYMQVNNRMTVQVLDSL